MTWSIVARDADGSFGVAIASRFLAVGALCVHTRRAVGALSTQALMNPLYGPAGIQLLADGVAPEDVVARLTDADEGRAQRQLDDDVLEADQAAEEPAPLRLALDEELLQLAAVEEDSFAGRALLDLDVRDVLEVHVAAALGALAPVGAPPLLGLGGLFIALRAFTPLPRGLDHRGLVVVEPVVLAPLSDVFGIECHGGILG